MESSLILVLLVYNMTFSYNREFQESFVTKNELYAFPPCHIPKLYPVQVLETRAKIYAFRHPLRATRSHHGPAEWTDRRAQWRAESGDRHRWSRHRQWSSRWRS